MKKRISAFVFAAVIMLSGLVHAEDLGVIIISPDPNNQAEGVSMSLDNILPGEIYNIDGFAQLQPKTWSVIDRYPVFAVDKAGDESRIQNGDNGWKSIADAGNVYWGYDYWPYFYENIFWETSSTYDDFACLEMDVVNLQKSPVKLMEVSSVKVVYQDKYEFPGWIRQYNYDYDLTRKTEGGDNRDYGPADYGTLVRAALAPENEEPVDMMYTGHFVFGAELPTAVLDDISSTLKMVITLGDNEATYCIRGEEDIKENAAPIPVAGAQAVIEPQKTYEVPDYARVEVLDCSQIDMFPGYVSEGVGDNSLFQKGDNGWKGIADAGNVYWGYDYWPYFYSNIKWMKSGESADFVTLKVDVTNMQTEPFNFMEVSAVRAVYKGEYEYQGWLRQINYDYRTIRKTGGGDGKDYGPAEYGTVVDAVISPDMEEPVSTLYTGHYLFGVTLPTAVTEDKKASLSIFFTIGDTEYEYQVRK